MNDKPGGAEGARTHTCPNCGDHRLVTFCACCGQSDRQYARALGPVAGELLRETFEVDSRLWRTLKLLLFKPGGLTREFSRNRRARYMSPIRLYLAASFLFFLVMSLTISLDDLDVAVGPTSSPAAVESVPANDTVMEAFKAGLSEEHRRKVDAILARPEGEEFRQTFLGTASLEDVSELSPLLRFVLPASIDFFYDPMAAIEDFIGNLPIVMFFMLPLFALALAVCYVRRRVFYVEHLVFAFHVQTVFFLLFVPVLVLPDDGFVGLIRSGFALVPFPYFLIAIRRYYRQGWALTIAKSIGVSILYFIALALVWLFAMFASAYF